MVVGRPYCRFLCPYGALLRLLAPLARWPVQITRGECVNCHLCANACPYGAIHPPTPEATIPRRDGRTRLALLLLLLPVLVAAGAFLVRQAAPVLARLHPAVRTAEQVYLSDKGVLDDAAAPRATAFAASGAEVDTLRARAARVQRQFDAGSLLLGAWLGLVVGIKLIALAVRRRRAVYGIDPAACVACGRCYASCPLNSPATAMAEETEEQVGVS
jgi:ferredoxin